MVRLQVAADLTMTSECLSHGAVCRMWSGYAEAPGRDTASFAELDFI